MKLTHAVTNVTLPLTLTDRYGYHSSHGYYLNNNIWGLNPSETNNQITMIDGISTSGVAYHVDWSFPGSNSSDRRPEEDYEVKSYPYAGLELGDEKRLVEDVGSLWTKAEWGYYWPEREGRANVAIDIFTAEDADRDISGGDYELMIWLARYQSAHPIGTSHGMANIANEPWELFIGYNGETKVYSFVAPEERPSWEGDVMSFFRHIERDCGFPAKEQHLTAFQFGTETYVGRGLFAVWYWMGEVDYLD